MLTVSEEYATDVASKGAKSYMEAAREFLARHARPKAEAS